MNTNLPSKSDKTDPNNTLMESDYKLHQVDETTEGASIHFGQKSKTNNTKIVSFNISQDYSEESSQNRTKSRTDCPDHFNISQYSPTFSNNGIASPVKKTPKIRISTIKRNQPSRSNFSRNFSSSFRSLPTPKLPNNTSFVEKLTDTHQRLLESHIEVVNYCLNNLNKVPEAFSSETEYLSSNRGMKMAEIINVLSTKTDSELENILHALKY